MSEHPRAAAELPREATAAAGATSADFGSAEAAWRRYELLRNGAPSQLRRAAALALFLGAVVLAWHAAHVDLGRLIAGLPKLGHWLAQGWPPNLTELPIFVVRMGETVAIAFIGTLLAALAAVPLALFAARGVAPLPWLRVPLRWLLNALRGIDAFIFALVFVAAVGLGPFAGLLGVALHTCGSAAKLFADQIETMSLQSTAALRAGGAGGLVALRHALLPELLPLWSSNALYLFEFNVRASTVLGVVGAGGIGQEVKASMDLLDFARLATLIGVILVAVTLIDTASAWLRRRLR